MLTAIWAILIFCILIFVHEFGHFITAKLSGMTVHEFSIGMGPKILGFGKGETKYSLRLIPFGGYVKMEGEDGDSADPNAFCNKSALKRFTVLFAGAFMNVLLGFLIFALVYSTSGSHASNTIGGIIENSAFDKAGIVSGDKIIRMEGDKYSSDIRSYRDINIFISLNGNETARIVYEHNGERITKDITPTYNETEQRYMFGFSPKYVKLGFWGALYQSFWQCIFVIKSVFLSLWWLISGVVSPSAMSGPVAIVSEIGVATKAGWRTVLNFAGFISVNLGVMNLLPIPALDGGRILFLAIEKIRGKKMNSEREAMINFVFFAALIFLMILVTFSDISKLI